MNRQNNKIREILYLTPNRRLSLYLKDLKNLENAGSFQNSRNAQNAQNADTKIRNSVFYFSSWCKLFWQEIQGWQDWQGCEANPQLPRILSESEEKLLWEGITGNRSFALLAKDAFQLCCAWKLDFQNFQNFQAFEFSEEALQFKDWVGEFRERCENLQACSESEVMTRILQLVQKNSDFSKKIRDRLPEQIIWVGFEHLTPMQMAFMSELRNLGIESQEQSLLPEESQVFRCELQDFAEELNSALTWAKSTLTSATAKMQESFQNQNTIKFFGREKIGIVIPELGQCAGEVSRIVAAHAACEDTAVSVPESLLSLPLINGYFLGLGFLREPFTFDTLSLFLRGVMGRGRSREPASECISVEQCFSFDQSLERSIWANLEVFIRERKNCSADSLHWSEVLAWLNEFESSLKTVNTTDNLELLNSIFEKLKECFSVLADISKLSFGKQPASEWKLLFERCIEILSGAGESENVSWVEVLNEWLGLESLLGELEYEAAVQSLKILCQDKLMSLQNTQHEKPIQIMGLLEALGLPFSRLWVLGLNRDNWPDHPKPNPLIPHSLQNRFGLPKSTAMRELDMAKSFTRQLAKGGKEVIFSLGKFEADNQKSWSPLLNSLPEISREELGIVNLETKRSAVQSAVSVKVDKLHKVDTADKLETKSFRVDFKESGRPLNLENNQTLSFGSEVLKLQSLCPFRAFSELRLGAAPLADPGIANFSASRRGEILHAILNLIWLKIGSHQALFSMKIEAMTEVVDTAIAAVLKRFKFGTQFSSQEKQRLQALLIKSLELEKERAAFEVIKLEEKQTVQVGALRLNIRIDRLDRVKDQGDVVIDYKTGQTSVAGWFGERPLDPQLPLYGLAQELRPVGLALNTFRPEGIAYKGISKEISKGKSADSISEILPGLKPLSELQRYGAKENLETQWETWKTILEKLADDFVRGEAAVDPVQGETTCRVCGLKSLCRVSEKEG